MNLPPPPPGKPNVAALQDEDRLSRRSSRAQEAELQIAPLKLAGNVSYDGMASARPPNVDPISPSAAPSGRGFQSATVQGDIYVDGSRLGRWMTDRLFKSAELPRGATTGFDPRMTATWPGSPVST